MHIRDRPLVVTVHVTILQTKTKLILGFKCLFHYFVFQLDENKGKRYILLVYKYIAFFKFSGLVTCFAIFSIYLITGQFCRIEFMVTVLKFKLKI